jgi:hypothetical protein
VRVRVLQVPRGEWDVERLSGADPSHLGLLIVDGMLARELLVQDVVSTELLGPGDIVRPWQLDDVAAALGVTTRWIALAPSTLGLIDRNAVAELVRFPELVAAIADRLVQRSQRLALTQAFSQLTRVRDRLLFLFRFFADRWGRVSRDGIVVPLALSHRQLSELVGARRPTVSTALGELLRDRLLVRRGDGSWLLPHDASNAIALEEPEQQIQDFLASALTGSAT